MKKFASLIAALVLVPASLFAQATWTNAGMDNSFSNSANWTPSSVPTTGSALVISSNDLLGLDIGTAFTASTITVNAGLTASILPAGAETLTVTGGLTLLGSSTLEVSLPFLVTGTQSWTLNSGTFTASSALNFTSGTATIALGSGASFVFGAASSNPDWLGTLDFTGTVGATALNVSGGGLTLQNIGRITINGQAAVLSGNYLTAVPEPSTYAAIFGALALGLVAYRRRLAV